MKKYISISSMLIVVSILSACSTPKNALLEEAHHSYNNAISNPQISSLAALELKDADNTLKRADSEFSQGNNTAEVNHLSYMAIQKVNIAQETAKRKSAELAVNQSNEKMNLIRLGARTAEADAANLKAENLQATSNQQAAELAAASVNAERSQSIIEQQELQLKELNAKKTKRGMVVTLGDVLFNTNESELKFGGTRSVQKLSEFLKKYPQYSVLIEGYTDSRGSLEFNQKLSERRAESVRDALANQGIGNERISTAGYGEMHPLVINNSMANRQVNRRVEIILSDENGNITKR